MGIPPLIIVMAGAHGSKLAGWTELAGSFADA
jgi:hypothetical protein